jgi:hypothetical protein
MLMLFYLEIRLLSTPWYYRGRYVIKSEEL